jgi:uncharacterized membrane protein SpoIIM required for sporulation
MSININRINYYQYKLYNYYNYYSHKYLNISFIFFLVILVLLVLYSGYIIRYKIKHRFWSKQPVFQYHHFWYWIYPRGILYSAKQNIPFLPKYYEHNNVKIKRITMDNETEIFNNDILYDQYCSLVKNHYTGLYNDKGLYNNNNQSNQTFYQPSKEHIHDYLKHHNLPCYYGIYNDISVLLSTTATVTATTGTNINTDTNTGTGTGNPNKINLHNNVISGLISRPLIITFLNRNFLKIKTNYVDFLCTHSLKRKKSITPKLIYSFAYNVIQDIRNIQGTRNNINNSNNTNNDNNNIIIENMITPTFLFKKEYDLTPFVPFISFYSYVFDITYWNLFDFLNLDGANTNIYYNKYSLSIVDKSNLTLFTRRFNSLLFTPSSNITTTIVPNFNHLSYLFEKKHIICFMLHHKDNVKSLYFFKNSQVSYQNYSVIEFIGSLNSEIKTFSNTYKNTDSIFFNGFIQCLVNLKSMDVFKDKPLKYIIIENISHNHKILKLIKSKYKELQNHHSAYYLYNMIETPIHSKHSFILC